MMSKDNKMIQEVERVIPKLTEIVFASQTGACAINTNVLRMVRSHRLLKEPMQRNLIFLYSHNL